MKPELRYLIFTALLTGTLWVPVVIGYVRARGPLRPIDYKIAPTSPLPDWVNRANRAHLNAVESFAPFAAVVLAAASLGVSTPVTAYAAAIFSGPASPTASSTSRACGFRARTLIFSVGWGAFVTFAVETLRRASP